MTTGATTRLAFVVLASACTFRPPLVAQPDGSGGSDGSPGLDGAADADPIDGAPCDPGLWGTPPTNFSPCQSTLRGALALTEPGIYVYSPLDGALTKDATPYLTVPSVEIGSGPRARLVEVSSLTIADGVELHLKDGIPVLFAVHGTASIAGVIDASGDPLGPYPGADDNNGCAGTNSLGLAGANGVTGGTDFGAGGGSGGGYGGAGGAGGEGGTTAVGSGGLATMAAGTDEIAPLRGGCSGGKGGDGWLFADGGTATADGTGGGGGGGGGALQISAAGSILLENTADLRANGAGGGKAIVGTLDSHSAGGGGGSGGAIFLESFSLTIATGARLCANGGSGGEGAHHMDLNNPGQPGPCAEAAAVTTSGSGNGGDGGRGGFSDTPQGLSGGDGAGGGKGGGGGGGGSAGRIRLRVLDGAPPNRAQFVDSPSAVLL